MAQIGRRLAEKLLEEQRAVADELGGVDPEVVEAAALAHDLGHPPFGHVAETELDEQVKRAGVPDGFEGNAQTFRIVTKLAVRRPEIPGLNLTRATLNAVLKYPWFRQTVGFRARKWGAYHDEEREFSWAREVYPDDDRKSAEAELMDWADDIAHAVHDVEDFYRAGLIPLERLAKDEDEVDRFLTDVFERRRRDGVHKGYSDQDARDAFHGMAGIYFVFVSEPYTGSSRQRAAIRLLSSQLIARYVGAIHLNVPADRAQRRVAVADWRPSRSTD